MEFNLDSPKQRVKAQQTVAAALQIQQSVGPVVDAEVQAVIAAAMTLDKPMPFLVATALLRRGSVEELLHFLPQIVALAATQSTSSALFNDAQMTERLAMAIRGGKLDGQPRSWWATREAGDTSFGPQEELPPRKFDRQGFDEWMDVVGWSAAWGFPKSRFSS